MKNIKDARNFLRLNENSGNKPYRLMYKDHKGIPTISTGFNLQRRDAKNIIESVGAIYEDITCGKQKLTAIQALKLEKIILEEAESILISKISQSSYDYLGANQQAALISLCVNNPDLIGPNLIKHIRSGNHDEAVREIKYRSNKNAHPGLQNRRDREAALFEKDIPQPRAVLSGTTRA